jgi:hypothetical protein
MPLMWLSLAFLVGIALASVLSRPAWLSFSYESPLTANQLSMPAKYRVWFEDQHHLMEVLAGTLRSLAVLVRESRQYHSFGI